MAHGESLCARVMASASDPDRLAVWSAQGVPVLRAVASWRDAMLVLTTGHGADVAADPVGGALFDQALRCLAWGVRLLVLGFAFRHLANAGRQSRAHQGLVSDRRACRQILAALPRAGGRNPGICRPACGCAAALQSVRVLTWPMRRRPWRRW